jgi:hypothetical protein
MFVNKRSPFLSQYHEILNLARQHLPTESQDDAYCSTTRQECHNEARFQVNYDDGWQFENLRGDLADMQITLNIVSNDEHKPRRRERYIRNHQRKSSLYLQHSTIQKKDARNDHWNGIQQRVLLNSFSTADGVSETPAHALSWSAWRSTTQAPSTRIWTHAGLNEEYDNPWPHVLTGAIALRPTGNEQQGAIIFPSLSTGRRLNRNQMGVLPMPADVIARVHTLARAGVPISPSRTAAVIPTLMILTRMRR